MYASKMYSKQAGRQCEERCVKQNQTTQQAPVTRMQGMGQECTHRPHNVGIQLIDSLWLVLKDVCIVPQELHIHSLCYPTAHGQPSSPTQLIQTELWNTSTTVQLRKRCRHGLIELSKTAGKRTPGRQPVGGLKPGAGMSRTITVCPASPRRSQDKYRMRQLICCL